MKLFFITLITLLSSTRMSAQDTTRIYVDNQQAAMGVLDPVGPEVILQLQRSSHKRARSFIVVVTGEHIGGNVYRRDLEITGDSSTIVIETINSPGIFDISQSDTRKQLVAGKTLSLYLRMSPSNPGMMIPAKRIYLGKLVMK